MKIGKNIIQGIYKYVQGCQPTQGDLLLHNGNLWVCNTDTPGNSAPGDDEPGLKSSPDYSLYLAPTIATEDEVLELLKTKDSEWPDKAVPMSALDTIFSSVYYGLTRSGVIENTDPVGFDRIVEDPDVSHGIFAVSRSHSDVVGLVMTQDSSGKKYESPVFLKKYTYIINTIKYILLELSDYETGMLWYKCYTLVESDDDYKIVSGWKIVSPSADIKKCIETVVNQYKARLAALKGIESTLRENFRFRKLTFPETPEGICRISTLGTRVFTGSSTTFPTIPWATELDYTVVVLVKSQETGIYYSESVTVPARSNTPTMCIGVPFTIFSEELRLLINKKTDGVLEFSLQGIPAGYTGKIASVYYQDFYYHGE